MHAMPVRITKGTTHHHTIVYINILSLAPSPRWFNLQVFRYVLVCLELDLTEYIAWRLYDYSWCMIEKWYTVRHQRKSHIYFSFM